MPHGRLACAKADTASNANLYDPPPYGIHVTPHRAARARTPPTLHLTVKIATLRQVNSLKRGLRFRIPR